MSIYAKKKFDILIGTVHPTHPQLSICGKPVGTQSKKKYPVLCSICACDAELHGDAIYWMPKDKFENRNHVPCGCSPKPTWTEHQYHIIIKRECEKRNYAFLGWASAFNKARTYLKLSCKEHGEWCSTDINHFISNNKGCTTCSIPRTKNTNKKFVYICIVYNEHTSHEFVGYGITNDELRRYSEHKSTALLHGYKIKNWECFEMNSVRQCVTLESSIKHKYLSSKEQLSGFKTENSSIVNYDNIKNYIKSASS